MISYQGSKIAFLTQHGKQEFLKAPLELAIGCQLIHTDGYNTDLLGTFTGDVLRAGTQLEAARRKALIGMELTGLEIAISSEGAFEGGPFAGLIPWDTEVLLWVDRINGLEIVGVSQGPAQSNQKSISSQEELLQFATEAKFPEHHLVVRPEHKDHQDVVKGIRDQGELIRAFELAKSKSRNDVVIVENDLRAFSNPTRQGVIREAADNLILKLKSECPICCTPGFWIDRYIPGLPCSSCGTKTKVPKAEVWLCSRCGFTKEHQMKTSQYADPRYCDFCNP